MEETKYQLLHPGSDALLREFAEKLFQIDCPGCGAKICRASEGSQMTTFCPKCRHLVDIEVSHGLVKINYSEDTKGSLKAKAAKTTKEMNKAAAALRRQRKAQRNRAAH